MTLHVGLEAEVEAEVTETMTAAAVGSGLVAGLSTPSMVGLMEAASVKVVSASLPPGTSTVGSRLDIAHLAPTPVGMRVRAHATLREVDGRRLVFQVSVTDEVGEVGTGMHERYLIDLARFEERMASRIRSALPEGESACGSEV